MKFVTIIIWLHILILITMILSCSSKPVGQKYAVRKIERIKGNAYLVSTDSFKVLRHTRGVGKYRPDSVTKKLITNE